MKPKYWWYGIVKKQIMMYKKSPADTLQAGILEKAMRDANRETKKLPNGDLRLKAVNDVLIEQKRTYDGVSMELNYSERVIRNWVNSYINLVGKKAGY